MTVFDLGAAAEYHETGDMVLVTAYLLDPTPTPQSPDGTFKPQLVKSGVCSLTSGNTTIDVPIEFDRRSGTRDGNYQLFFLHPSSLHHLKVSIEMVVIDGTSEDTYTYETPVIRIEAEDTGLEAQPWEEDL